MNERFDWIFFNLANSLQSKFAKLKEIKSLRSFMIIYYERALGYVIICYVTLGYVIIIIGYVIVWGVFEMRCSIFYRRHVWSFYCCIESTICVSYVYTWKYLTWSIGGGRGLTKKHTINTAHRSHQIVCQSSILKRTPSNLAHQAHDLVCQVCQLWLKSTPWLNSPAAKPRFGALPCFEVLSFFFDGFCFFRHCRWPNRKLELCKCWAT